MGPNRAAQGVYGAGDPNTYMEIGAGERMLRKGLTRVYEMLGKVRKLSQWEYANCFEDC